MMFNEVDELEVKINQLKIRLIEIANETGLNSPETLYCSQILDEHIIVYQNLKIEKVERESFAFM